MTIIFLNLQITMARTDIWPHIRWAVSLVIAYGHFNLPQGFVWVLEKVKRKIVLSAIPLRAEVAIKLCRGLLFNDTLS